VRQNRMTLEFGERLCATYEAYLACFPHSDVEIEELLSLVCKISSVRTHPISSVEDHVISSDRTHLIS